MKTSRYNFIIEKGERIYCFNASTFKFFILHNKFKPCLEEVLADPDRHIEEFPHFKSLLLDGRFLVENNENEIAYLLQRNYEAINRKDYKLTILPTFGCNFSCWYCVQHHRKEIMQPNIIERVKKHITFMVKERDIHSLNIEWFWGEPLLEFNRVIQPITHFAKCLCDEKSIPFFSSATTNGYLFSKDMLFLMRELNMSGFQITLDGLRSFHDKTRVAPGKSSFDQILRNVNLICEILENAQVTIRINYDNDNFIPELFLKQIQERLDSRHYPKVSFLLRKVWQVKLSEQNKLKNLEFIQKAKALGFSVQAQTFLNTNFLRCYACRKYYNTIATNGKIYKCTALDEFTDSQAFGKLTDEGKIEWFIPDFEQKYFGYRPYDNEQCESCKYLPLCWGECPRSFEKSRLEDKTFRCAKPHLTDLSIEEAILSYCETYNNL